jgi:hypothetical protein
MHPRAGRRHIQSMDVDEDDESEDEFLPYLAIPLLGRIALVAAVVIAIAIALFA